MSGTTLWPNLRVLSRKLTPWNFMQIFTHIRNYLVSHSFFSGQNGTKHAPRYPGHCGITALRYLKRESQNLSFTSTPSAVWYGCGRKVYRRSRKRSSTLGVNGVGVIVRLLDLVINDIRFACALIMEDVYAAGERGSASRRKKFFTADS